CNSWDFDIFHTILSFYYCHYRIICIAHYLLDRLYKTLTLKEGINDYISKYNYQRFHSSIGYKKPMNVYLDSIQYHTQMAA
ncbi:MAG TPA: hypothetical protein LFV66_05025, partial [Rickettsia endosymbiont of Bembidion lapponicum]|nr:hypothetical protein [Rickettsia endosymbiont of Bembidion lapponicum]